MFTSIYVYTMSILYEKDINHHFPSKNKPITKIKASMIVSQKKKKLFWPIDMKLKSKALSSP